MPHFFIDISGGIPYHPFSMQIAHRYTILKKLSESLNSRVYQVKDTRTGEVCALKLLTDPLYLSQFKKEFTILQTITHPSIVKALDFGSLPGKKKHYLTMEYVDGAPFTTFLKGKGIEQFGEAFLEALRVINFVHEKGFVHCDLKPQNILVDGAGCVKLVDFGFAQMLQSVMSEDVGGTISYIAPEVLRGENPDVRADIYSLGIIGYESLSGEKMHKGIRIDRIFDAVLHAQVCPIKEKNSEVPAYLNEVIMKMISKQRLHRFSNCEMIISAIERKGKKPSGRKYVDRMLFSDFIGRQGYIEAVAQAIADAREGRGSILLLEGIPGVGKTRFLKEIEHRLFVDGMPVQYTKATGHTKFNLLWLIEIFERAGAELSGVRKMLEQGTISVSGTGRHRFFQQCIDGLVKAAGDGTLVFLIDDVDFSDSVMVDFIRFLSGIIEKGSFFFAITSEVLPDALGKICSEDIYSNVNSMRMDGMSREENEIFIKNMLGVDGNVEKLSGYLHDHTAGNPFFTEELLKEIIEKRHLRQLRGNLEYDLARIKKLRIPKGVDIFVSTRIKKISSKEKDILELVAAFGDSIPFTWLLGLTPLTELETVAINEGLKQKQFLTSSTPDVLEFTHKIVRTILYKGIPAERRKKLHTKVLTFLQGIPENYHILNIKAQHAFEGRHRQAKMLSQRLLKEAVERQDARRALAAFEWLKGLSRTNVIRSIGMEQALRIGSFYGNAGDYPAAITIFEKLVGMAGNKADRVKILHYLIMAQARFEKREETIRRLEELLTEKMPRDRRFEILLNLGGILVRRKDYTEAKKVYKKALELSKKGLKQKHLAGRLHYNLCILRNLEGDREAAIEHARKMIDIGEKYQHNYFVMLGWQSMGYVEHSHDRLDNAMRHHLKALGYLRKNEILTMKLYVLTSLGQIAFLTGDHDGSKKYFNDAMVEAKKLGERNHIALLHALFGKLLSFGGEWEHALSFFRSSTEIAQELDQHSTRIESIAEMLKLYVFQGNMGGFQKLDLDAEHAKSSLENKKPFYSIQLARAIMRFVEGNYRGASEIFEKVSKGRDPRPSAEFRIQALIYSALCKGALNVPDEVKASVRLAKGVMNRSKAYVWKDELRFAELIAQGSDTVTKRKAGIEKLLQETREKNRFLAGRIAMAYGDLLLQTFLETGDKQHLEEALKAFKEAKLIFEDLKAKPFINTVNKGLLSTYENMLSFEVPVAKEGRYLNIIAKFGELIKNIDNPEHLKSLFVSAAKALTGAERGVFLAFDREKEQLIAAEADLDDATVADAKQFSLSVIKRVKKTKQPLIVHDAVKEGRFRKYESVRINKIRSILCIPVVSGDRVFGALYLDSRKIPWLFSKEEKEFFIALSNLLADSLTRALDLKRIEDEATKLKQSLRVQFGPENMIGQSEKMQLVFDRIERFADSEVPVLILGESGTGKEVTARTIHSLGKRKERSFLVVDCSGLSPSLIESELFGYRKGAFTGAREDKMGLFEAANGGTLFIDEIANASESLQSRLLRFFDTSEVKRIGSTKYLKVNTRIIVATNRDLYQLVQERKFSEDLFYRLSKFIVNLPPLRERKEDIKPLVDFYLDVYNVKHKKNIGGVTNEVMDIIMKHDWPGNVRELVNEIEKWVFFCNRKVITGEYVSEEIAHLEIVFPPLQQEKSKFIRNYIMKVLSHTGGNVSKAARILKTDKKTIYRNLKG